MEELIIPLLALAALFLVVSFFYSAVGLGGGSSYVALMTVFAVSHTVIPTVSLSLNLIVTFVGSINFIRQRHARGRLILPFLITSIPMSYLGGRLEVPATVFYWVLLISLVAVAARIYFWDNVALRLDLGRTGQMVLSLCVGAALGLICGMVGIGGGIYLVPLIMILGLGSQKEAAACGAIFIWGNSLAGLTARLPISVGEILDILPLAAAVLIGGTLGSHIGSSRLSPKTMQKWLGAIILVAIFFLVQKIRTA